jgi:YidC/Oxa1 family membrane protein insertase
MQPQQKNLLIFFVLSFLIFVGWSALQNYLWPPKAKTPAPKDDSVEVAKPHPWGDLPPQAIAAQVGLAAPIAGAPVTDPVPQLASQVGVVNWTAERPKFWALKTNLPPPEPVVKKPKQEAPRSIVLGNDSSYNLHVTLTTLGAGVEKVILNDFQEANELGRPVFQENGEKQPLHLIPGPGDDPTDPSYLLFHFPTPKAPNPVPVNTLGIEVWHVKQEEAGPDLAEQKVVMEAELPRLNVRITKTFTLKREDYHIGLEVKFEALKDKVDFRYQLAGGHGLPIEGVWYTYTYRNSIIGVIENNKVVDRNLQDSRSIGVQSGGKDVWKGDGYLGYAAVVTQYFTSAIVLDDQQEEGVDRKQILEWARPTVEGAPNAQKPFLDDITVRVNSVALELKPGQPVTHRFLLYNGPVKVRLLGSLEHPVSRELVDRYENKLHLATLTDFHSPTFFGTISSTIGWTSAIIFFTNVMHWLLDILFGIFHNYGVCIIVLTVLVRGSMFPFSRRQALASAKMQEKMATLAPEVKKLEEKHKNDPMALQQAKNELYVRNGINPLAMMGSCWMVLVQMPIFMGLYYCLQESIHLRLAPFLWMKNLAAPDMLIWWGENIPWLSRPQDLGSSMVYLGPFFNILPVIAVALMIAQQKMLTPPPTDEQQAMQQKMMKWMMVLFGFMFYKVAGGLCIYFIASSLWGLTERKLLPRRQLAAAAAAGTDASSNGRRSSTAARPGRGRGRKEDEDSDGLMQRVKAWWADVLKQASKK